MSETAFSHGHNFMNCAFRTGAAAGCIWESTAGGLAGGLSQFRLQV